VREHEIATDVFGRPPHFEPGLDSTVRVQTARLRAKLAHYYTHEGAADSLILEIPKNSYTATFRYRAPLERSLAAVNSVLPEQPVLAPVRSKQREHWVTFLVVAITLALISVAVLGYFLATQNDLIWAPFAADHESPVL
jgi:nitrate reductase NapE component